MLDRTFRFVLLDNVKDTPNKNNIDGLVHWVLLNPDINSKKNTKELQDEPRIKIIIDRVCDKR